MASQLRISRQNLLWMLDNTLSSLPNTEDATFGTDWLKKVQLFPGLRLSRKALDLDGGEYAFLTRAFPNDAMSTMAGDFALEAMCEPSSVSYGIGNLMHKLEATKGYALQQNNTQIRVILRSPGWQATIETTGAAKFAVGTETRIRTAFDVAPTETIYILQDGTEIASATNAAQTGCTLTGTIPLGGVDEANVDFAVGATAAGGNGFRGKLGAVGMQRNILYHGGYLFPSNCQGYWDWSDSDLTDKSGQGNDLDNNVGIGAADFVNWQAFLWLRIIFGSAQSPKFSGIPRQHNLTTGALVKVQSGNPYGTYTNRAITTVTADKSCVGIPTAGSSSNWWIEIIDGSNTASYIEIPVWYLGPWFDLTASFDHQGLSKGEVCASIQVPALSGNYRTYQNSELTQAINGMLKNIDDTDKSNLRLAQKRAVAGFPIWFAYDKTDYESESWLMNWRNSPEFMLSMMRMKDGTNEEIWTGQMDLRELAEGIY